MDSIKKGLKQAVVAIGNTARMFLSAPVVILIGLMYFTIMMVGLAVCAVVPSCKK